MLGFATLGKFALGQVGPPSVIVVGVSATGSVGVISASIGTVSGVSARVCGHHPHHPTPSPQVLRRPG